MGRAVIPCLRYADAPAAIDFLCRAFGFARQAVYADEADPRIIHHAQLVLDDSMIMLGSDRPSADKDLFRWKTPSAVGGITMSIYVVVADPDAHHARAMAEGAQVVQAPHDNVGYPGRGYSTRDPEGNLWSFGSYDPF